MAHRPLQSAYLHLYEDEIRRVDLDTHLLYKRQPPADLKRVESLLKTLDNTGIPAIKSGVES
jgi:hypothetical protein